MPDCACWSCARPEPVVHQRHHRGQERGDQRPHHHVGDEGPGRVRQRQQDDAEHELAHDQDQEHHDVGAEHVPGVAADGRPALAERLERGGAADHDPRHDQRQERQQDQPGHDDQREPDRDGDGGEDRGDRDAPDERQRRVHARPQVEVAAPVARVLHGLDQRRLQQEGADQAEQAAEDGAERTQRQAQQRGDDRDHQVDRERDEQEVGGVALVQRPRLAQHAGERVHALMVRIYAPVTYA